MAPSPASPHSTSRSTGATASGRFGDGENARASAAARPRMPSSARSARASSMRKAAGASRSTTASGGSSTRIAGTASGLVADADDFVALVAAGHLDLDDVAFVLADQRARDRRAHRDQA